MHFSNGHKLTNCKFILKKKIICNYWIGYNWVCEWFIVSRTAGSWRLPIQREPTASILITPQNIPWHPASSGWPWKSFMPIKRTTWPDYWCDTGIWSKRNWLVSICLNTIYRVLYQLYVKFNLISKTTTSYPIRMFLFFVHDYILALIYLKKIITILKIYRIQFSNKFTLSLPCSWQ